jgi:hypothetical protein
MAQGLGFIVFTAMMQLVMKPMKALYPLILLMENGKFIFPYKKLI